MEIEAQEMEQNYKAKSLECVRTSCITYVVRVVGGGERYLRLLLIIYVTKAAQNCEMYIAWKRFSSASIRRTIA